MKGLCEYYDDEEEEYAMGILVLDISSKIPYCEKNNKVLEEFALKLKKYEDERLIKRMNNI